MDPNQFGQNLGTIVANGFITNALCIGYDLGIFKALAEEFDKPVTSEKLASKCGLKKRYVEEWLGCMVASNIIEMEGNDTYFIPPNCKGALGVLQLAGGVPRMALMFDKVKECFKKDGPKGFSFLDLESQFLNWMNNSISKPDQLVSEILEEVGTLSEGSVDFVLDVGCGEGTLARSLSRALPKAEIYAVDYNSKSIEKANALQTSDKAGRLTYNVQDVGKLPDSWEKKFDMILLHNVLHDFPNPITVITEMKRVLKDDGVAVIVDPGIHSSHTDNKGDVMNAGIAYTASCFVCLPSSMNMEKAAGFGMGWGMEAKQKFLEENGFVIKKKICLLKKAFECGMFCTKK